MITLKEIYNAVNTYQCRLGYDTYEMGDEERMDYLRQNLLALHQEVAELADSFPWKPWRSITGQTNNRENATREIIDCIFFLIAIARSSFISADELEEMFGWVLDNNYNRILIGYNNTKESNK